MNGLYLSEQRWLRFVTFAILYFAQGMPLGLLAIALPAWLAAHGASPALIASFIGVTGLPWGLKLFSGPLMDRFSFPPMGRRRPWVMGAQGGLFLSMIAMALVPDPLSNVHLLMAIGFIVNMFAAVQDVAVDGMAIDILPREERGRANAFMGAGQVMGSSISAVVASELLNLIGLFGAVLAASLLVGIIFLFISLVRERLGERLLPWTTGSPAWDFRAASDDMIKIVQHLWKVLLFPMSLLLTLVEFLIRFSGGFLAAIAPIVVVQELGFSNTVFSQWIAAAGVISALFGVAIGPLIDRYGSERFIRLAIIGNVIVALSVGLLPDWWSKPAFLLCVLFVSTFAGQIIFISIIALYMNICWTKVAATQFAIYMALSNLSRSAGAGAYALIVDMFTTADFFLLMGGAVALSYGIFHFFDLTEHRKRLDMVR